MIYPELNSVKKLAEQYTRVTVYREIFGDSFSTITLLKIFSNHENIFLLESANADKTFARYSFFGYNPKRVISFKNGKITISNGRKKTEKCSNPFEFLRNEFTREKSSIDNSFGDFNGGFVGFFGYESVNYMGNLRKPIRENKDEELIVFFEVDEFFVYDAHKFKLYAACSVDVTKDVEKQYESALKRTEEMEKELKQTRMMKEQSISDFELKKEMDKPSFINLVDSIRNEIIEGEAIQVVLSNKYTVDGSINPVSYYRALRHINPSSYMFFFQHNGTVLCGSSPETHLKVKNNVATLKPIAGTYRIHKDSDVENIKKRLLEDPKENAEHLMLLDLARNDLYTSCTVDSVKVVEQFHAEVYSHVVHIVSSVQGNLREGVTSLDIFQKTFPAGTVSGAPKVRAIELINQYEPSTRGFYAGCVGYFGYCGSMDTCITIRSAKIEKDKVTLRAGAGIVFDSVAEKEFEEVEGKLAALFEAIKMVEKMEV